MVTHRQSELLLPFPVRVEKECENVGQPDEAPDQEFNEFSEMIGGHSSQITQISENQQGIQEQLDKIQTALQKHGIIT